MEQVFTNGKICKAKIIESIALASKDIRIAMAFFTDKDIAKELIKSQEKGIDVTVILSNDLNNENIKTLLNSKCKVYSHTTNGRGIMHHKFCIVDSNLLLHGSYNYTYNAVNHNEEALNLTDSYNLISEYSIIFETLLKEQPMDSNQLISQSKDDANYLDKFTDELKNHISQIFDNFNQVEISKIGFNLSKASEGSEPVFINYLDSTLAEVNTILNQNDHTKVLVKTRMTASLDRTMETNAKDIESDLNLLSNHISHQKNQVQAQIDIIKENIKVKQEEYNKENALLAKYKAIISELNDGIDNLDRQISVRKFWVFPTFLKLFLSLLLIIYLSIFFGSAIWKIFFEESEIMKQLAKGITPEVPPLFDANSLVKIYTKKGGFYGFIATIFFIFPVLLTSIKMLVPNKKVIDIIGLVIGIFIIDIVVSILISQHTFEIKRLVTGSSQQWMLQNAIQSGEFWLIFIFGSLPLFLTKFLIENIWLAYNHSNPESVDRERFLMSNSLKRKLSENNQEVEIYKIKTNAILTEIEEFSKIITQFEEDKNNIEAVENNKKFELRERSEKKKKNLREIYNSFIGSVDSGNKLFLQNVINGRITAFKQGFFLHLTSYYHQNVVIGKIDNLEAAHKDWTNRNFE